MVSSTASLSSIDAWLNHSSKWMLMASSWTLMNRRMCSAAQRPACSTS